MDSKGAGKVKGSGIIGIIYKEKMYLREGGGWGGGGLLALHVAGIDVQHEHKSPTQACGEALQGRQTKKKESMAMTYLLRFNKRTGR